MPSKWTPRLGAVSKVLNAWAEISRVLDGTQSHSTQWPPSPSSSTIVAPAPRSAATRAAPQPPGPPPTITTRMGRWYRLDARRTGVSADPSEGGHQGDEHPAGQAEADQVDAAGPAGADADGGQEEAGEGGQVQEELEGVGHCGSFRVENQNKLNYTRSEWGPTYAKPLTLRSCGPPPSDVGAGLRRCPGGGRCRTRRGGRRRPRPRWRGGEGPRAWVGGGCRGRGRRRRGRPGRPGRRRCRGWRGSRPGTWPGRRRSPGRAGGCRPAPPPPPRRQWR